MKSENVDFKKFADTLREKCPCIMFATLTGIDENGVQNEAGTMELCVFTLPGTRAWESLESILGVTAAELSEGVCGVTLLNRADAITRFKAIQGNCLFIRKGREQQYRQFVQQASLSYRIWRAQCRRQGIIDNC